MKGALLLIGVLVCVSMTEASSFRRAKSPFKAIQNRHFKTTVAKGKLNKKSNKVSIGQDNKNDLLVHAFAVSDGSGCGDTCDLEFVIAYVNCPQEDYYPDIDAYIGCLASNFDSDCHDCLCDYIYTLTGESCPAP